MRYLLYSLLTISLFAACKKDKAANENASKVDIYILKSFSLNVDQAANPSTLSISNAVLADTPLVADKDIKLYTQSSATFSLTKNVKTVIKDYGADKAFAITLNKQPIYFGIFHPSYLSSIAFGLATIDPTLYTTENEITIQYATITGNSYLFQLDKRNDDRLINSLRVTGKLR